MRWRLGRTKTKAGTPGDVVDIPTNRASSTSATAATGTDRRETSTNEADNDRFYYATASCFDLRQQSVNSAGAVVGARIRTNDGLTSSLASFVEGLGSHPRRQSSSAENAHYPPSSAGLGTGPDSGNGGKANCGGGADVALLSTAGGSIDGSIDSSSNTAAVTTAETAASSLPTTDRTNITHKDLLVAEVHGYLLRRGGVDHKTAAAARVCLALLMSLEPTLDAIQDTRPADLVSLAKEHLDLSAGASACLLHHLADDWPTAARLIATGADLDDSHLRDHLAAACRLQNGHVNGAGKTIPGCSLHRAGTQTILSGTEALAASGAEAAEAATILYQAYRTWRDIVEAINNTTRRTSGDHRDGAARARATQTRVSSVGEEEFDNISSPRASWFCSLKSPRGHCRPRLGGCNACSAAATAPMAIAERTGERQEGGQQDRVSHRLRQAVRMVTSGAHNSYGQLVVLGYKEFLVRDSTWHRVGLKNEKFVLAKRKAPNGVDIGGRGRGRGGSGSRTDGNGIRIVHENNVVCTPLCLQADGRTATGGAVCSTPTYDALAVNDGDDEASETRSGASHGHPSDFKTPEPRPNGVSDSSCGGRNPTHRRARCGGGTGNTTSSGTGGRSGRGGCGVGETRDGGGGHRFSSTRRGSGRDVAESVDAGESVYRMQLFLSADQREAAESMGIGRTPNSRTAGTGAGAGAGADDVVNISCSANDGCDMYQLGRMEGGENDFAVRGPLHRSKPGGKVCGPVSRYAVRFLVDRAPPHRCRVFGGGFNSRKCLSLPKSSPKWREEDGEWDAVTPFGVRILKPEVGEWREVTVAGAVRQPRAGHLNAVGALVRDENNELTCGTVVDVGGVQILYESAETMSRLGGVQPSRVVELLNSRKPQCPIQLQTLRFRPWKPPPAATAPSEAGGCSAAANSAAATPGGGRLGGDRSGIAAAPAFDMEDEGENTEVEGDDEQDMEAKALVPHVFLACGHVQGYAKQLAWGPCPMCRTPGPLVEILFGWCPAIDREVPTVVFNPCGHAASLEVAERWAKLAMPNNAPPDAVYRPICPYCAKPLQCKNGEERPYSKMIFAR